MTLQVAALFSLIYLKSLRQVGAGEGTRGLKKGGGGILPPVNPESSGACGIPSARSAEAEGSLGKTQISL